MKKCSFCGEVNPDDTVVCPWCGRRDQSVGVSLDAGASFHKKEGHPETESHTRAKKESMGIGHWSKLRASRRVLILVTAFFLIVGLGIGYAIASRQLGLFNSAQPSQQNPTDAAIPTVTVSPTLFPTSQ